MAAGGRVAVAMAVLTLAAAACSQGSGSEQSRTSTTTTVAAPQPATLPSCVTEIPATWQKAIDESTVETGGVSNVPMAVGRRGEVAVSRDDGDARNLLLIGP